MSKKLFYLMALIISLPTFVYSCYRHGINENKKEVLQSIKEQYPTFPNDNIRINVMTKDTYVAAAFDGKGTFIIKNSNTKTLNIGTTNWKVVGIDKKYWGDSFEYSSHSKQLIMERMYRNIKLSCMIEIPNINIYQPIIIEGNLIANCLIAKVVSTSKFNNIRENIETDAIKLIIYPTDKSASILNARDKHIAYSIFDSEAIFIISFFATAISFGGFFIKWVL